MATNHYSVDNDSSPSPPIPHCESALPGFEALVHADLFARDAGADIWDFALEIDKLYELGLTINDLRWMIAKGYAEHGKEVSSFEDPHRSFDSRTGFCFEVHTCLILTTPGIEFAVQFLASFQNRGSSQNGVSNGVVCPDQKKIIEKDSPPGDSNSLLLAAVMTHWQADRREFHFGNLLVKRFRVPARNQEFILDIFEEDGWPECIDDPLPPSHGMDPKTRLHAAINRLNHKQINPVIRFHGNGNGTGVYWEGLTLPIVGVV